MSECKKDLIATDEANRDHEYSSCQNGNGSDYFGDAVDRIACLEARGTEEDTGLTDCADDDPDFSTCTDVFIDPKTYEISMLTKDQLSKMPKSQLTDYTVQIQLCYADLQHNYALLAERSRKDRVLKYVSGSDRIAALNAVYNRQATTVADEESPDTQSMGNSNGDGPSNPKRTSMPKRGPNQREKWEQMPVYEKDADFTNEQKKKLFLNGYRFIRKEKIEELRTVPTHMYIFRRIVYVYQDLKDGKVVRSLYAKKVKFLPGSLLSADVLAHIASDYYMFCVPVDRQVKKFYSEYCPITSNEVYKWLRDFGKLCIRPVAQRMLELVLLRKNMQSDETYFKSIEEMLQTGRKYCYFWLVRSSELDTQNPPIAVIRFVRSRSAEELARILGEDYDGMIECDGWGAYPALTKTMVKVQIACCLTHVRHYFSIAVKSVSGISKMTDEERMAIPAYQIIVEIGKIFHEEALLKNYSREERLEARKNKIMGMVTALYDHIEAYARDPKHDPKSLFGKAVTYAINRKAYVLAGILNPDLPIHNSACERNFISKSIFRNGSKAFSSNENAAVAGDYFTVATTCQENGGNVKIYYQFLFENIPALMKEHAEDARNQDFSFLDEYMPWGEKYKAYEILKAEEAKEFFAKMQKNERHCA